jgi:hypothetical protein
MNTSPSSSNSLPYSNGKYAPSSETFDLDMEPDLLTLGSFDNQACWDDPIESALSHAGEPTSSELSSRPLTTDMDTADLRVMPLTSRGALLSPSATSAELDNIPIDSEESITVEVPSQNAQTPPETTCVFPCDGLLSWEQPQLSHRIGKLNDDTPLSSAEESRHRSIATPALSSPGGSMSSSAVSQATRNDRTRMLSDCSEPDCLALPDTHTTHKINARRHNMVEKRYRTNINDKITALRDSVPSLHDIVKSSSSDEELRSRALSPPRKLNKVYTHYRCLFILNFFRGSIFFVTSCARSSLPN